MSPLTITTIQTDLHWEDKEKNLRKFEEKIMQISAPTELIVLPEMFSTGFSMHPVELGETMQGETVQWMRTIAARKRAIITGSVIIKENEKYYNRLIWMLPDGKTGHYDKRHLFQYAKEGDHYTKGNTRFTASVNGWKILLLVCYDLRFPVWSRQQVNGGAEYDCLICVANWPSRRSTAWKTLLQARAIENQCYVVGVNRVGKDGNDFEYAGDSMVIDPLGSILYTKNGEEDVCTITLNKTNLEELRSHLPFLQDADEFNIIT